MIFAFEYGSLAFVYGLQVEDGCVKSYSVAQDTILIPWIYCEGHTTRYKRTFQEHKNKIQQSMVFLLHSQQNVWNRCMVTQRQRLCLLFDILRRGEVVKEFYSHWNALVVFLQTLSKETLP